MRRERARSWGGETGKILKISKGITSQSVDLTRNRFSPDHGRKAGQEGKSSCAYMSDDGRMYVSWGESSVEERRADYL